MRKFLLLASAGVILFACNNEQKSGTETADASSADSSAKNQAAEFADAKYTDVGKKQLADFESGNVDSWLASFSDSARYYWSGGDSLIGKSAIADYWKNRRANVIKAIKFSNDIWLPLKVNTPQKGPDRPGVWLMSWYQVNATYASGKSIQFWAHHLFHFDNNDKIDQVSAFMDMAPIKAAVSGK
jgi:hypothetical protein